MSAVNRYVENHAEARRQLLLLARRTLVTYLSEGQVASWQTDNRWLLTPAAVFVTLRLLPEIQGELGELRGCIGQIKAELPLYSAVQDAVIKAATVDPRFYPVTLPELNRLTIEVSVLSEMRTVDHLNDIQIGQDGLYLIGLRRRGLLLPEVAVTYNWNPAEFVRATCRKAGLPDDAWPESAKLFAFTTEAFEETAAEVKAFYAGDGD
jgi:AmmeMemoRadiSam system protein A